LTRERWARNIALRRHGAGRKIVTPSVDELKAMAREIFGRELSDTQAKAYRGRLPTMVKNVERLRAWEPRLRQAEPALVQRVRGADDE
jgi:hypothetical protein